jgi:hypothetical protein
MRQPSHAAQTEKFRVVERDRDVEGFGRRHTDAVVTTTATAERKRDGRP